MSEPTSAPDPNATPAVPPAPAADAVPAVPPAPTFRYDAEATPPAVASVPPPAYGAPGYAAPVYGAAPVTPRRTWDVVLTIILLVLGFFGMIIGVVAAFTMNDPEFVRQFGEGLRQQGMVGSVDFSTFGNVVLVSHPLLYVAALAGGIILLLKRKVAFYVPLIAGVIATAIFWGGFYATIFSSVDVSGLR